MQRFAIQNLLKPNAQGRFGFLSIQIRLVFKIAIYLWNCLHCRHVWMSIFFNCRGINISLNMFKLMLIPLQLKNWLWKTVVLFHWCNLIIILQPLLASVF